MTDNEIREFFHSNRPAPEGGAEYMASLNAKLAAIEEIKAIHDASMKHSRRVMHVAFAAGLLVGAAILAIVFFCPAPTFSSEISNSILVSAALFIDKWRMLLIACTAAAIIALTLIPLKARE